MNKYELTNTTIEHEGRTLHRVKALRGIECYGVEAGDLGGWIESEENLDQNKDCWVGEEAKVYDSAEVRNAARVYGDATVSGSARVFGDARVHGDAQVFDQALVFGGSQVYESAQVYGDSRVSGNAVACNNSRVHGAAEVSDYSLVTGNAKVGGQARLFGYATASNNASIYGNSSISGNAMLTGDAEIFGDTFIGGRSVVSGSAYIENPQHCITVSPIGRENAAVTITRTKDGTAQIGIGLLKAVTFEELADEVERRAIEEWDHFRTEDIETWKAQYSAVIDIARTMHRTWQAEKELES